MNKNNKNSQRQSRSVRGARLLFLLAWLLAPAAQAGEAISAIKARGELRCGVSEGIAGFSERDQTGRWTGLDADFCRAVAAAVLGDAGKVSFVPLKSSTRFPALQAGRIDLLVRNTTWTFSREVTLNVQFPAVLFYDGQAFMVPKAARVAKVADLHGATVCVEKGTTHIDNLAEYFEARGLKVTPLVIDSTSGAAQAFFAGRCLAYTSDASQLAAMRLRAPGGAQTFRILPERISKEPLAPAVMRGDPDWTSLVRWVLYALILAEEHGLTRANIGVESVKRQGKTWDLVSGKDVRYGQVPGVPKGWALRAIAAVGNYGEMYERHAGSGSPLQIERGLNRLWNNGGLMYAPPVD